MIHSLFIVNEAGDIFCEKHWRTVVPRSICDYFFEALKKSRNTAALPDANNVSNSNSRLKSEFTKAVCCPDASSFACVGPVIPTPQHVLITLHREQIYYIAVIGKEVSPLFVLEFLHRCVDTFRDYFNGEANEHVLKENLVLVYEILDEMLDNGFPLATEPNILQELIKPPSFWASFQQVVSGSGSVAEQLPQGQLSNVPWRRAGVKYNADEAFFDVIEVIDAVLDGKNGAVLHAEINGSMEANIKLSGMPDLVLSFVNPRILDGVTFHPCVRYRRWDSDRVLSFVPPDGRFRLLSYHINESNAVDIPLMVRPLVHWQAKSKDQQANFIPKIEIYLQVKQQTMMEAQHRLTDVVVEMPLPQQVVNCCSLSTNVGRASFNATTKVLQWTVDFMGATVSGAQQPNVIPALRGTIIVATGVKVPVNCRPEAIIRFKLDHVAMSGLRVNRLDIHGDKPFKAFKGVKYQTIAGSYTVRTV